MSFSSTSGIPARQPYGGGDSSSIVLSLDPGTREARKQHRTSPFQVGNPDLSHLELGFLRVIGRNKIPIVAADEIQLDCRDRRLDTLPDMAQRWRSTKSVGTIKEPRSNTSAEARLWNNLKAMTDKLPRHIARICMILNFEFQIMSKPSLRKHRDITELLAVCFDSTP
jgi:hypothetical protein